MKWNLNFKENHTSIFCTLNITDFLRGLDTKFSSG